MFHTDTEIKQIALALTTAAIQKTRWTADAKDCEKMVNLYFDMLDLVKERNNNPPIKPTGHNR